MFIDVDRIEPGSDFVEAVERAVGACDVLVALIGPLWSQITDRRGRRRLDVPDDPVALEIRLAPRPTRPSDPVLRPSVSARVDQLNTAAEDRLRERSRSRRPPPPPPLRPRVEVADGTVDALRDEE